MSEIRNDKGQLQPGHGGLKKRGDNSIQKEIRQKIADLITDHFSPERVKELLSKVSAKEQLRFFVELLPYQVARRKEIEVSGELQTTTGYYPELTKLSQEELTIFLKAFEKVKPKEGNENNEV